MRIAQNGKFAGKHLTSVVSSFILSRQA